MYLLNNVGDRDLVEYFVLSSEIISIKGVLWKFLIN